MTVAELIAELQTMPQGGGTLTAQKTGWRATAQPVCLASYFTPVN